MLMFSEHYQSLGPADSYETEAPVMWLDTGDKHLACQLYLSQSKAHCTAEKVWS